MIDSFFTAKSQTVSVAENEVLHGRLFMINVEGLAIK
jgi:hypothetical protein